MAQHHPPVKALTPPPGPEKCHQLDFQIQGTSQQHRVAHCCGWYVLFHTEIRGVQPSELLVEEGGESSLQFFENNFFCFLLFKGQLICFGANAKTPLDSDLTGDKAVATLLRFHQALRRKELDLKKSVCVCGRFMSG